MPSNSISELVPRCEAEKHEHQRYLRLSTEQWVADDTYESLSKSHIWFDVPPTRNSHYIRGTSSGAESR